MVLCVKHNFRVVILVMSFFFPYVFFFLLLSGLLKAVRGFYSLDAIIRCAKLAHSNMGISRTLHIITYSDVYEAVVQLLECKLDINLD